MRVLNVGGGMSRVLPKSYLGWEQDLLDIDKSVNPDICCDAKKMGALPKAKYDAVYCSHNLEHFYKHEVPVVLGGFMHVLKSNGFAQIAVPDLGALIEDVVRSGLDIDETWYQIPNASISFHDVLYGWNRAMSGGNLFYSHKCGFTEKSLGRVLSRVGFKKVVTATDGMNLHAYAFKTKPNPAQVRQLGL